MSRGLNEVEDDAGPKYIISQHFKGCMDHSPDLGHPMSSHQLTPFYGMDRGLLAPYTMPATRSTTQPTSCRSTTQMTNTDGVGDNGVGGVNGTC